MTGEEILRMTSRELRRLHLVRQYLEKEISQKEGSEVLGLSGRQFRRLVRRVREEGSAGIIHRSRGRPSNRRSSSATRGESPGKSSPIPPTSFPRRRESMRARGRGSGFPPARE